MVEIDTIRPVEPYSGMHQWTVLFERRDGFQARVARRCGVSRQTVNEWPTNGIPIPHCAAVEAECGREFMRWDFHPNDWWRIWPELIDADGAPAVPRAEPEQKAA